MKILAVHNHYRSSVPSGEKSVYLTEIALLRHYGHDVITYEKHNDALLEMSPLELITRAGISAIWSRKAFDEVKAVIKEERPDVAHFHNTFPQISPAAYYACKEEGVPVVQTVHNFRFACINGVLFRAGAVCEECLDHGVFRGALHGCYHASRMRSLPLVSGQYVHKWLGTYKKKIDVYIVLTDFMKRKMIRFGIPSAKIVVKPNAVDISPPNVTSDDYFIYVGRLDSMKGIETLIEATVSYPIGRVVVVGDGEMAPMLKQRAPRNIDYVGSRSFEETLGMIAGARSMIVPSLCYEGFPRVIVEAFACGTPVIASEIGGMAETVRHGKTGLLFHPGDAKALAQACMMVKENATLAAELGGNARDIYESFYTPEKNYHQLMNIYRNAMNGSGE